MMDGSDARRRINAFFENKEEGNVPQRREFDLKNCSINDGQWWFV